MGDVLPPESNRMSPDELPTPFSAEEIRAACAPGRSNTYLVEKAGADPYLMRWEFVDGDDEWGESQRWTETPSGERRDEPASSRARWTEFQGHASYPAATTKVSPVALSIEAGEFECWLYTTEEEGSTTRAWFARTLPGPPVRVVEEAGGAVEYSSTLVAFADPRAAVT